ncbi:TIGR01777 family oxidoreductase [Lentibacillus sp. CBA3610]|uniref:TIGR01777 family oxidoreductase n=1 Tax=Lentibacillus sp. CBA3610 TaxID=2518176 RepID=UPI001594F7CE|nr:TIGR01777 family oxidoreductase [Lentibacillus sp. CBA3610]QKY68259.1 TIGR01777 family protein [Lentibacillus sp. CBA3610]
MNIMITGGTGFVGRHLTKALTEEDHHVYILTRSPEKHTNTEKKTFISYNHSVEGMPAIQAVINLAGESLFGYWTEKKKESIRTSRINTTRQVVQMMDQMETKPDVFISGSAVGFYGTSEDLIFTENTTQSGDDFLAEIVMEWEQTAKQAEELGIRTVFMRFGIILGKEGALPLMKLPVKMFAGGRIGNGEQWISWIHVEDVVGLIQFCLFNQHINGPVNVTAPHPKRNKDFTHVLAKVLRRPDWIPAPSLPIRTVLGQMSLLILEGQYAFPQKAKENDFSFVYPYLQEALQETEVRAILYRLSSHYCCYGPRNPNTRARHVASHFGEAYVLATRS